MKIKKREKEFKKGFSIAEVVLSVFVLTIGIVGIMSLMAKSLRYSMDVRDQIVAAQLAQEGLELVMYIRDSDVAAGNDAFSHLGAGTGCYIDYTKNISTWDAPSFNICTSSSYGACDLYYLNGFYGHTTTGAVKTKFNRRIAVVNIDSNTKKIMSIVSWDNKFKNVFLGECTVANKCVYAETRLTK